MLAQSNRKQEFIWRTKPRLLPHWREQNRCLRKSAVQSHAEPLRHGGVTSEKRLATREHLRSAAPRLNVMYWTTKRACWRGLDLSELSAARERLRAAGNLMRNSKLRYF